VKKIAAILILILYFAPFNYSQTYVWKQLPNAPVSGRNDDISFVTPMLGWVATGSGQIFKTTDGGDSWQVQLQTTAYLRSLKFADSLNGWAGTLDKNQLLFHTTNGGKIWNLVTNLPAAPVALCGLSVVSKDVIYGSGAYFGPPVVIKSTDSGLNWEAIDMSSYTSTLVDCHFFNKDSGFVIGGLDDGVFNGDLSTVKVVILFTSDGGNSWQTKYIGQTTGEWGWKISFPTRLNGYVSVENFNSASVIKTTDGGNSWNQIQISDIDDLEGIGFVNQDTGWTSAMDKTAFTTDGGKNWQLVNIGSRINRYQFFGDTLGYASGRTVYKYERINSTAIKVIKNQPKSFFLSQNYPNPFNPSTTIQYTLPEEGNVLVRIYDGLGKELRTILDDYQSSGTHKVK
jgi:photosystem II stability/assembly factor-like uncharacterized protein